MPRIPFICTDHDIDVDTNSASCEIANQFPSNETVITNIFNYHDNILTYVLYRQ